MMKTWLKENVNKCFISQHYVAVVFMSADVLHQIAVMFSIITVLKEISDTISPV